MAITIEKENTLKESLHSGVNLFLGAGFSTLAQDEDGCNLPAGEDLRNELIVYFDLQDLKALPLPKLYTIIDSTKRERLRHFLRRRFTVVERNTLYQNLTSMHICTIFTTNIDNLIPLIFKDAKNKYLNNVTITGPAYGEKLAVDYVPLHGNVLDDQAFTFAPTEIASSFSSDRDRWSLLVNGLQAKPTIFFGYSLEDAGVLEAIAPVTSKGKLHQPKWIQLRAPKPEAEAYFSALGFNVIVGSIEEVLNWFAEHGSISAVQPLITSLHPAIAEHLIPNANTMAVRPLRDFYSGAAPTWEDILSDRIFRTSHFSEVIEKINSKKSVVVLGMFASGKTTLMMQVAAGINFAGVKLVCPSLTGEKAALIGTNLLGTKALVFLDDFADNIAAFQTLLKFTNVQVVAFERDYAYERVSHLVPKSKVTITECTDLSDRDLQGLYSAIPSDLRKASMVKPEMEQGLSPSLYETIEQNLLMPRIRERFAPVMRDLEKQDELLHDFLVMCSYVHMCRTPVSFDMAYAYLKGDLSSYSDVYHFVSRLKSFVVDYAGTVVDHEEDHFIPRSMIISNAVLENAKSVSLKRVLMRFHEEVSPLRIVRFDVFRRRGFDEFFATKAFPDWTEGLAFYEMLSRRDDSPYLYQQAALYLMHRRRYKEAFRWIDQAIEASRGKIPSIRNSYAVIMFRANISAPDPHSAIVSETLRESMIVLTQCYKDDERKNFHVLTFADQAVQYWNVYKDEHAKKYLKTARSWLSEQRRGSPWHRGIGNLLRQVDRIIDVEATG